MLNQSGIYEILNTVNGKRYIGSAKNFKVRWSRHLSLLRLNKHYSKYLQASWNKYGEDAFKFLPILTCSKSMLLFYEQQLLDRVKPEYNTAPTAGNTLGIPCSDEKRKKISKAHTGKVLTEEHKAAIAAGTTGKRHTEESIQKMCAVQQKRVAADPIAFSKAISDRQMGHTVDEDTRKKIGESNRGKPKKLSTEARENKRRATILSNQTRGVSDATKKKMSDAKVGKPMHPNTLAVNTERMKGNSYRKGIPWTPEMREEIMTTKAVKRAAKKAGTA